MRYIQSFYQYPITFSSVGKTIPAKNAVGEMKNIAEFSEKEIETLEKCEPFYRELVKNKKIRVLNHLPSSYVSTSTKLDEVNKEAETLKSENEELKKRIAELEASANVSHETDETDVSHETTEETTEETATKKRGRKAKSVEE